MRGRPTAQAQRAIDALKAAGYKRSEFRVRTEWDYKRQGYGNARISVWADKKRQQELAIEVAKQGVQVLFLMRNGELGYPMYYEHLQPGIVVFNLDKMEGEPPFETYVTIENLYPEE